MAVYSRGNAPELDCLPEVDDLIEEHTRLVLSPGG